MTECTAGMHGTVWAYTDRGCRCPETRALMRKVWRDKARKRRAGQKVPHTWANHRDVDEVAVLRALTGERMPLGLTERQMAVAQLTRQASIAETARRLGCAERTVQRHRARLRRSA